MYVEETSIYLTFKILSTQYHLQAQNRAVRSILIQCATQNSYTHDWVDDILIILKIKSDIFKNSF